MEGGSQPLHPFALGETGVHRGRVELQPRFALFGIQRHEVALIQL